MLLRAFTPDGIQRVAQSLNALKHGDPDDPRKLLESERYTWIVSDAINIDPRHFADRQEAGLWFDKLLDGANLRHVADVETDEGLWTWLSVLWFDEIAPVDSEGRRRIGQIERYVFRAHSRTTSSRHLLNAPLRIVRRFAGHVDDARILLSSPISEIGGVAWELLARQNILSNQTLITLATRLYVDPQTRSPKPGSASSARGGSVQRLVDVLAQLDATWDTWDMPVDSLLDLLPPEFDRFKPAPGDWTAALGRQSAASRTIAAPSRDTVRHEDHDATAPVSILFPGDAPTSDMENVSFAVRGDDVTARAGTETIPATAAEPQLALLSWPALTSSLQDAGSPLFSISLLSKLDERAVAVLGLRLFTLDHGTSSTLDELGTRFGITRERIRQIESDLRELIAKGEVFGDTGERLAASFAAAVHPVALVPALEAADSTFQATWLPDGVSDNLRTSIVARGTHTVLTALVACAAELHTDGTLVWAGDWAPLAERVETLLSTLSNHAGVAMHTELEQTLAKTFDIDTATATAWLDRCGMAFIAGRRYSARLTTSEQRVAALLSHFGAPATTEQLWRQAAPQLAERSFRNLLSHSQRFMRVSKDSFALAAAGAQKYTGIRDAIGIAINEHGGRVSLRTLQTELLERYSDISPTSIAMFAQWPPYQTDADGIVRPWDHTAPESWTDLARVPEARVDEAGRLHLQFVLTSDHERGSGSQLPVPVAWYLGLRPGEIIRPRDEHSTVLSWKGAQPSIGTIRSLIIDAGLHVGDAAELVWEPVTLSCVLRTVG